MVRLGLAFAAVLAFVAAESRADSFAFGSRQLEIPAPSGFVRVTPAAPQFHDVMAQYIGQGNRLVETWAPAEEVAALARGEPVALARYFQLQVLRDIDGRPVDAAEFRSSMSAMERQVEQTVKGLRDKVAAQVAQGNEALQAHTGSDVSLDIGEPEYLGVFAREPWALFVATLADVTVAGASTASSTTRVANGSAVVLADHQVLFLYAYADYDDADDLAWVKDSVRAWAADVRAGNPDDPAVAAQARRGFDTGGVGRAALIGAIIGGLVAVVAGLARRRRGGA
jgi:hypothetical protein